MTYYVNPPQGLPTMTCHVLPGRTVIGSCSKCGGSVSVHSTWMSVIPDVPTCDSCGAKKASFGPIIEMR